MLIYRIKDVLTGKIAVDARLYPKMESVAMDDIPLIFLSPTRPSVRSSRHVSRGRLAS